MKGVIYQIKNEENDKVYIGSTNDIVNPSIKKKVLELPNRQGEELGYTIDYDFEKT